MSMRFERQGGVLDAVIVKSFPTSSSEFLKTHEVSWTMRSHGRNKQRISNVGVVGSEISVEEEILARLKAELVDRLDMKWRSQSEKKVRSTETHIECK